MTIFHTEPIFRTKWATESEQITSLDPLEFDVHIGKIAVMNQNRDLTGLLQLLIEILPTIEQVAAFDRNESIAAMRDIGIILGSVKRLDHEPCELLPPLNDILALMGAKTDLPPRDTLSHYTIWNPQGARLRTYTHLEDERHLIESVRISMYPLVEGIYELLYLHEISLHDREFAQGCKEAETKLSATIEGVFYAKRNVSPVIIANVLRFFFDPIKVHGIEYIGPRALEMPLFVFDHLLWSSDTSDREYIDFKTTYLPFYKKEIRTIYHEFEQRSSLVTKAIDLLNEGKAHGKDLQRSATELLALVIRLKSLRMPHKELAEVSYSDQDEEHRHNGSEGYTTDILSHILSLNLKCIARLESAIKNVPFPQS